jgi:hypothetical protein
MTRRILVLATVIGLANVPTGARGFAVSAQQVPSQPDLDETVRVYCAHLQKRPGTQILCSFADLHHGMLRFTWKMVGADGKTLIEGIDFGEVAADGTLKKIVGFFGQPKPRQ